VALRLRVAWSRIPKGETNTRSMNNPDQEQHGFFID
jgi:hypothetical protein